MNPHQFKMQKETVKNIQLQEQNVKRIAVRRALTVAVCGLTMTLVGCKSYTDSTPRKIIEDDPSANYQRVFGTDLPSNVTVLNSIIISYSWRPGVITTDDFEFELLAPPAQLTQWEKQYHLSENINLPSVARRKMNPIRAWYAPKDLPCYRQFCDRTSVGYVHMLVDLNQMDDGRIRVFISKH